MAKNMALGVVIGGAVAPSIGKAFAEVNGRIKGLGDQAKRINTLGQLVRETERLQKEWRQAHLTGSSAAEGLRKKLEANLEALRRNGLEARNLARDYQRLDKIGRGIELTKKGREDLVSGRDGLRNNVGTAVAATATLGVPTKVSSDYNAIIRDIAIKAGTAGTAQESEMSRTIVGTARASGLARNDVAAVVNQLVGAGMDVQKALAYAPVASKFVVGQGAAGDDTGRMINALGQNAKITDPRVMQQALEAIAYQGQAGSFEAADMAKWFPELLSEMEKIGITGLDAVTQLGAMLQVQMKTAGSSDEAANNLKNWFSKIGSTDTVKQYKDAGIDYDKSLHEGIANKMSTLEASLALAQKYVLAKNPEKEKQIQQTLNRISNEGDRARAKSMLEGLESSLRTGDIFADMQVKAALTAWTQGRGYYEKLKSEARESAGIIEKNLDERRDASQQKWKEVGQNWDDAMRSMGDAISPWTDRAAVGLGQVATGLSRLADDSPRVVRGVVAFGGSMLAIGTAVRAFQVGRGLVNLGRGTLMGNANLVQRVFVTNQPAVVGADGGVTAAGGGGAAGGTRPTAGQRVMGGVRAAGPGALLGAITGLTMAIDTAFNARTRGEKAEGYGQAVGTTVGTVAGTIIGGAVGSFVPVVGTAIGAALGGTLGAWFGGVGGGKVGKAVFGDSPTPEGPAWRPMQKLPTYTPAPMLGDTRRFLGVPAPLPGIGQPIGDVARALTLPANSGSPMSAALRPPPPLKLEIPPPKVEQSFTFAPQVDLRVEGDVRDPQALVNALMPEMRRQFDDYAREQRSRALYDAPHN